jgi:hypothetical protein
MDAGQLADRRDLAGLGIAHLVRETQHLLAQLEDAALHLDDVADAGK